MEQAGLLHSADRELQDEGGKQQLFGLRAQRAHEHERVDERLAIE
jgi:hypothetical protein